MPRLINTMKQGKYEWRAVLDTDTDCNYLERTSGAYYQYSSGDHFCLKCHEQICWMHWTKTDTRASSVCDCGENQTLQIMSFSQVALNSKD